MNAPVQPGLARAHRASAGRTPKIVVTNPIHDEVRMRLEAAGRVEMNTDPEPWTQAQLTPRLRDADAMMGFMTDCVDDRLLLEAPHLRIVACALKGFDSYDVAACTRAGVWVSIVPDLLTEPTAELALGLAIALARNLLAGDAHVRSGRFRGWRPRLYGTGLAGSTVAIIGMGKVGRAIATRLSGFGCERLLGVDPDPCPAGVQPAALAEAMAVADYVFVAAPLTPGSLGLVNAGVLAKAKAGQFIINVGRGSVVDEDAVVGALDSGRLAGYAADVYACEDWGLARRPDGITDRLLNHPDTVFTPHLGSAVRAVRIAIEHRAADNILAVLAGAAPGDAINRPERALA
jgi:phosphonate dehydrogenase